MKSLIRFCISSLIALSAATSLVACSTQASQQSAPAQPAIMTANQSAAFKPGINKVTFQSEGETLVGNLYLPKSYKAGDKLPTVIVTGAWMTIKEQMPAIYAQKLADQGFAALAFDFRSFGESGGKLRDFESPTAKITDIKSAILYLQTVDAVVVNSGSVGCDNLTGVK